MTTITKKIDLNVSQPNNYQLVHAMQGDSNTVEILATIWNGNKLYSIDCDRISLEWQSPSGGKRDYPILEHTDNTVTFILKDEMLVENGDYAFCIRFDNGDNDVLRTFRSTMRVIRAPFGQLMDSEVVTLTELVNKAKFYYEQLISESSNLACNLLYLPDIVNANSAGGASWQGGRFFCNIPSDDITVWSCDGLYSFGKIPLPEGGYVYPASSDSADVLVIYTLDGKENQVEVSNGAVLPENAVVTEYRLERKAGASRIIADIYPMISSGKRPVSEFVPYTGDGRKINKCVAELAVPRYEVQDRRLHLSPGESLKIALGKISRWFQDLKEVAFSGSYNDLADKPDAESVGALPITGGTLTGGLRIKGSGNYGTKINLGDGDYVHLYEPTDDCLEIKAKKVNFLISDTSDSNFTLNGAKIPKKGDLDELKKSVSDGKSAVASAITDMGVSTSSDAAFSTMSSNIRNISKDANAQPWDIIEGKSAYSNGQKIIGTLKEYSSVGFKFVGATCKFPPNVVYMVVGHCIDHVTYNQLGLHFKINSYDYGNVSEYNEWNCPYIRVTGTGGINVLRSNWSIDATNYGKMLVTLYGKSDYVGGSMEFRGCVGVCAKDASSSTGGEGRDYSLSYASYSFNSTSKQWLQTLEVDLSWISQEVRFHMSTVHAGEVWVNAITFIPN